MGWRGWRGREMWERLGGEEGLGRALRQFINSSEVPRKMLIVPSRYYKNSAR